MTNSAKEEKAMLSAEDSTTAKIVPSDKSTMIKMVMTEITPTKKPLGLTNKAVLMQILMAILANMTILSSGMGLGYPAITLNSLTNQTDPMALSEDEASWFASVNAIACPFGGLLSGYILDKFGRKATLGVINLISIVSWGTMSLASRTDKETMFVQMLVARVLIGIVSGLSSSPATVYCAEIAHPKLRGRLSVLTSLAIALGILIIYTLGFFIPTNWRLVSTIACGISVCAVILLLFVPESPSWLASKGKIIPAEKSLRTFRGLPRKSSFLNSELRIDIDTLTQQSHARHNRAAESNWKKLTRPEVYKPLSIMIGFFAFQQFSGTFVVVVYAVKFAQSAGVVMDPFLCTVMIGISRVIAGFMVGPILDRFGRVKPGIFSGFFMSVCMFGLIGNSFLKAGTLDWLPVALILAYIFASSLGLLTLPFTMIAEVYPQNIRGFASGLTICACFAMNFVVVKLYPTMQEVIGNSNVFLFYGMVSALSIPYLFYLLPETKGKTLDEIQEFFKGRRASHFPVNVETEKKILSQN